MARHRRAPASSRFAFFFVVVVSSASFLWWFRHRPAYLIYQAQSRIGKADQPAVIAEYKRLLAKGGLSKEDELKLRKGLAEFYLRALDSLGPAGLTYNDEYDYIDPVHLTVQRAKYRVSQAADHPFLQDAKTECEKILALDPHDALGHCLMGWVLWNKNLERFAMEHFDLSRRYDPNDARPLICLSRIYESRNEPATARDMALQAIVIEPENNEARLALMSAYEKLGNFGKMLEEFDKLSENFKDTPEIRSQYALALASQNYWEEASKQIDWALKAAPENGWVKFNFGRILLVHGKVEEASGAFGQASALLPTNIWPHVWQAYSFSKLGECEQLNRIAQIFYNYYEGSVEPSASARLVTAENHLCQGDDAQALSELTEALRQDPHLAVAQIMKAEILMDKAKYEELGDLLRPVLDEKENLGWAYSILAESFYRQGRMEQTEEAAESAIEADDRNTWPLVWLGLARGERRQFEAGERALQQAMALNKENRLVAGYYWRLKSLEGKASEAEENISLLLSKAKGEADLWFLLGEVQRQRKFTEDSITSFQRALNLKPYMLRAHLGLVASFSDLGRKDAARAALAAASKVNPENKDVAAWRAKIPRS